MYYRVPRVTHSGHCSRTHAQAVSLVSWDSYSSRGDKNNEWTSNKTNNFRDSGVGDSRPEFRNVGTIAILGWIILGCEGLSYAL